MIVDGHLDIAYNALSLGRDVTTSVASIRASEGDRRPGLGTATVGLPELHAGGIGLVFATIFVMPVHARESELPTEYAYATPAEAHTLARAQLAYYHDWEARGLAKIIRSRADLVAHQSAWAQGATPLGLVILMEGADPITVPSEAAWWADQGVRIVGPAWQATRYCGGTRQPGPLTDLGRALLPELADAGLLLDASHLAEASFWQVLELWQGPLIASHSNCRSMVLARTADRHLSDAMIKALVSRDAVIGTVLFNAFLAAYEWGTPKERYGLELLVRHIDHICQLAGDAEHVAIGSDLDGGLGREHIPRELDSIADMPRIAEALSKAGFTDAQVHAIMGENWLRMLAQALPA
jgi:membrane dipeptidase